MIRLKRFIRILIMVFVSGAIVFCVACAGKKNDASRDTPAPALDVRDARSGQALDISQLKGKVVFVNFWATWCPPCREEIPSIETLYREVGSNSAFVMVTILYKDDAGAAADFMRTNNLTFPVFADNKGKSAQNYGVTGVPETYLVDKKGVLRKRIIGPADWHSAEAKALINSLLAE